MSEIMNIASSAYKVDALKSLQYCAFVSDRHFQRSPAPPQPFWQDSKFKVWNSRPQSSMIMIRGSYGSRFDVRNFCVGAVNLLRQTDVPVIWTLKTPYNDDLGAPNVVDILKDLVAQALRLNISIHNEHALSLSCVRFRGAESANEWLDLLGSVLTGLAEVYIIVDVETVTLKSTHFELPFLWTSAFGDLFNKMSQRGCRTVVKLILLSYGSAIPLRGPQTAPWDSVIILGRSHNVSKPQYGTSAVIREGVVSGSRGHIRRRQRGLGPGWKA